MLSYSSAKHYQKQRQVTKYAHERHQNFSGKKVTIWLRTIKKFSEHEKQKLAEYRNNCFKM